MNYQDFDSKYDFDAEKKCNCNFDKFEAHEKDDCEEFFAVIPVQLIRKKKPVKPCPCKQEPKCHVPEQKCYCNK